MDLLDRLIRWINGCAASTDLQNLRDALQQGERAMHVAEGISTFTRARPGIRDTFGQARRGLGAVGRALGSVQDICLDLRAAEQIQAAIRVLNQDGVIQRNPEVAARAFGNLFAGFGRLAHHLPPPADAYAQILEGCGDFFVNMRRAIDPDERWRDREDWREAMGGERATERGAQ